MKPNGDPVNPIVKIKYSGDYQEDFKLASQAGFGQSSTPSLNGKRYVWHHLDDYDAKTAEGTMQLVQVDSHLGIPHTGGVSQYQKATGKKYVYNNFRKK
ncbi:HNH endonuclease [Oceanospirillum beijerinckii]|uniref:HNH endonuclease signature motif containing protein n=1 Tax=Oceanospirillum beijerinckii TaxID=64976 RepID=UPI0004898E94|nr:HNH endonuclease [Oceanospirillum beijerinckii]